MSSIKNILYSSLNDDLKNVFDTAESIHFITDDIDIPWEIISYDENSLNLKYSFGISRLSKRRFISSNKFQSKNSINVTFYCRYKK